MVRFSGKNMDKKTRVVFMGRKGQNWWLPFVIRGSKARISFTKKQDRPARWDAVLEC